MDLSEELRKYKALLDDEIITQEEFDRKKKELLGLTTKGINKEKISLSKIKNPKDNNTNNSIPEQRADFESNNIEIPETMLDEQKVSEISGADYGDIPLSENGQDVKIIASSQNYKSKKKKFPIIPIALGVIILGLIVVLLPKLSGGKIYKNGEFKADWKAVYTSFENSLHNNLSSEIKLEEDNSLRGHSYTFKYLDETCYFTIDTEDGDDKTNMISLATSNAYDDSRYDRTHIIEVLTTAFLAIDPSLNKASVKSEVTGRVESLRNEATGYGDKNAINTYEYKGISYILGYTYMDSIDYDVYQLSIYEPEKEK